MPPLDPPGRRVMEIRGMLVRLHNLVDPGSVLWMYEADLVDLELLALVEDELKADEESDDGERH